MLINNSLKRRENFLFDTENNTAFLRNTETKILSYISSTRVFLSYLTYFHQFGRLTVLNPMRKVSFTFGVFFTSNDIP